AASANFDSAREQANWTRWIVLGVAALLLFAFGRWAQRSVWAAIGGEPGDAATVANAVARGDLTVAVSVAPGDTTSVMAAMQRMCESLARLVGEVRESSRSIAHGSSDIASGNANLSQRTVEQASSLQS